MIEPILSLAISMQSNKGVYALLLGSGVSRSSGILTGWDIVQDLIKKLAHLRGEACEPDPDTWFRQTFDLEPEYSEVLDQIAKSSSERAQLLRGYFEPTDEERSDGKRHISSYANIPGGERTLRQLRELGYIDARNIVTELGRAAK